METLLAAVSSNDWGLGAATSLIAAGALMPFAVLLIALFSFITMIALISNTSAIEKRLNETLDILERLEEHINRSEIRREERDKLMPENKTSDLDN